MQQIKLDTFTQKMIKKISLSETMKSFQIEYAKCGMWCRRILAMNLLFYISEMMGFGLYAK